MSTSGNTKGDSSTVASTEDNKRKLSQDEVDQDESGDKKKGANKRKKTKVDITLCILDKFNYLCHIAWIMLLAIHAGTYWHNWTIKIFCLEIEIIYLDLSFTQSLALKSQFMAFVMEFHQALSAETPYKDFNPQNY